MGSAAVCDPRGGHNPVRPLPVVGASSWVAIKPRGPNPPLSIGEGVLYPPSDGLGMGAWLMMVTGTISLKTERGLRHCEPFPGVGASSWLAINPRGPSPPLSIGESVLYLPSDELG